MAESTHQINRPRVLFAEDYDDIRDQIVISLQAAGCDVHGVSDGLELLAAFAPGEFDLIIADLAMPNMGGFEALEKIRVMDSAIPMWILSAYSDRDLMNATRAAKLNALLLHKPDDQMSLPARIKEHFQMS